MELQDAVRQLLTGERTFDAKDEAVATEAGSVIDLVRGAVKDEAVKDANDAVKELMSGLEQKEAEQTEAAKAATTVAVAALEIEQLRTEGVLKACKPLGLGVEDALGVLVAQKDGSSLSLDSAKDRLIALAGEKNGALETVDGRKQTPVNSEEADAERAMDAAIERRKTAA